MRTFRPRTSAEMCVQVRRRRIDRSRWGQLDATVPRLTPSCVPEPFVYVGLPRVDARVWSLQGRTQDFDLSPVATKLVTDTADQEIFLTTLCVKFFTESLILAQDERWRRA